MFNLSHFPLIINKIGKNKNKFERALDSCRIKEYKKMGGTYSMNDYKILYIVLFSIALYFAFDSWLGIFAGMVLGYSVGLALDDENKKEDEE